MEATSIVRRVYSPQERSAYLLQFEQSGLSTSEFCRQVGIHPSSFFQWRRKARPGAKPEFAEVRLSTEKAVCPVTLHLPNGARLEVTAPTEATWLGLGLLLRSVQS